jgi:hypothetical protein
MSSRIGSYVLATVGLAIVVGIAVGGLTAALLLTTLPRAAAPVIAMAVVAVPAFIAIRSIHRRSGHPGW